MISSRKRMSYRHLPLECGIDSEDLRSGYCQQLDIHVPTTTVREALLFSAKLRRPQSVTLAENEA